MVKDYADQLLSESRNNVNHSTNYTHKCRCWGKCFEKYKRETDKMSVKAFEKKYGSEELGKVSTDYKNPNQEICNECDKIGMGCHHKDFCPQQVDGGWVTNVYYGPFRNFKVTEAGIWTTIVCPICGYSESWSVGDGNERF